MSVFSEQADGSYKNMSDLSDVVSLTLEDFPYTIQDDDNLEVFIVICGDTNRWITLPSAENNKGRRLTFVKEDTGVGDIILSGAGSDKINNLDTIAIALQNNLLEIISDGSEWFIISSYTHHDQFVHEYLGTKLIDPVDCDSNEFEITDEDEIRCLFVSSQDQTIVVQLPEITEQNAGRVMFICKDDDPADWGATGQVNITPYSEQKIGGSTSPWVLDENDETVRIRASLASPNEWAVVDDADMIADNIVIKDLDERYQETTVEGALAAIAGAGRTTETVIGNTTNLSEHEADETAPVHGSTSAPTANKVMHRDASGRAKVAAPAVSTDIALKSTVTDDIATHAALAVAGTHGSTVAATANKAVHRDAAGRAKVAAPAAADDIALKSTVTALGDTCVKLTGAQTIAGLKYFDDGFRVENRTDDPGSPAIGQVWFRTDI